MDPIREVIARAGRRLLLARWIHHTLVLLTCAIALAAIARGVQKLVPTLTFDWSTALPLLAVAAAVMGLLIAWVRRPKEIEIARTIDERAGLRETLSTAICVEKEDGAWSKAIVEDAGQKARRVVVKDAVPIEAPGNSWWPVAACAALLAVWWLPAHDVTGLLAKKQQQQAQQQQVQQVAAQLDDAQKRIGEILAQAGLQMDKSDDAKEDLFNPTRMDQISPEEMQRAAVKRLTDLADQLEAKRNSEEGQTFDAIQEAMKRLEAPQPGPAAEMSRALARGDFAEAKKQLEQIAEQIKSGEMSAEEKAQIAEQIQKMAEALQQMAEDRGQLEEQLQAAGLSQEQAKQLAADPSALQQALEQQGLSQEQINQLMQQAKAQQSACDAAGGMCQAMGQMAEGMQGGNEGQMSSGMESMSGQLSNLERLQAEMASLDQALGECNSQMAGMCENPGSGLKPGMMGGGSGIGGGIGKGGKSDHLGDEQSPANVVYQSEKANVPILGDGPVIASTLVYGSQVRGESTATFAEVAGSAEAQATEAIETKRVPREHEEAVKAYFGRLKKVAEQQSAQPASSAPADQGKDAGN